MKKDRNLQSRLRFKSIHVWLYISKIFLTKHYNITDYILAAK
jgi:hypothetical protein